MCVSFLDERTLFYIFSHIRDGNVDQSTTLVHFWSSDNSSSATYRSMFFDIYYIDWQKI